MDRRAYLKQRQKIQSTHRGEQKEQSQETPRPYLKVGDILKPLQEAIGKFFITFARVSNGEQDVSSQDKVLQEATKSMQIKVRLSYCGIPGTTYVSYLQDVVSTAKRHKVDGIVVESLDRLARPIEFHPHTNPNPEITQGFLYEIKELLQGVPCYSVVHPESSPRSFQTRRGQAVGKKAGRRKTPTRKQEKSLISRFKELRAEGRSLRDIPPIILSETGLYISHSYVARRVTRIHSISS